MRKERRRGGHRIRKASVLVAICLAVASLCAAGWVFAQGRQGECTHKRIERRESAPECDKEGVVICECYNCTYRYVERRTPPKGHTLVAQITPPSCTEQGYTKYSCDCGYSYVADILPPHGHEMEVQMTPPSCQTPGKEEHSCRLCDYSYTIDGTPPLGHDVSRRVLYPTVEEAGVVEYFCSCGYRSVGAGIEYGEIYSGAYTQNSTPLAHGIDVSRWNHQIDIESGEYLPLDWQTIRAEGFDFVILKAGSTKSGIEPTFLQDYQHAKEAGFDVGAYFYTYAQSVEQIERDAVELCGWLEGLSFEYPVYLDMEDKCLDGLDVETLSLMCRRFLSILQRRGIYCGLYSNNDWLTNRLDRDTLAEHYDIWYARYPNEAVAVWNAERYGRQMGLWQYTQNGKIALLEGYFDMNYAYKDYPALLHRMRQIICDRDSGR